MIAAGGSRRRRLGGTGIVIAVLASLVLPAGGSAAAEPAVISASGASLPAVRQDADGSIGVDIVDATGARHDAAASVIEVPETGTFDAMLDSAGVSAGAVRIEWLAVEPPERRQDDASDPSVSVRSGVRGDTLLGSAADAPSSVDIAPLSTLPVEWVFSGHGDYRIELGVTALDPRGAPTGAVTEVALSFRFPAPESEAPAPAPSPIPEPGPGPGTDPDRPPVDPGVPVPPSIPAGQSSHPAPQSARKRVIGAVHTDMVSAFLDRGKLALDSRADVDVTGDGIVDLGSRFSATQTLFHLDGVSRTTVPASPLFSFLGPAGSDVWLAPQTHDHRIIWPGFSTEHESLSGKVRDAKLAMTLRDVAGPGDVEVFLQGGTNTVTRTFSSTTALAPWTTGVPQHTHMNWAFSAPGTYVLTFEASGIVDGRAQTATNRYTVVVGDLAAHTVSSTTRLSVDRATVDSGQSLAFTATVSPSGAAGAVQFRDRTSGVIMGHTPVADGTARFVTSALAAGRHDIVAEFVPTWSNDVSASRSSATTVTVDGEVREKPTGKDTVAPSDAELAEHQPAADVVVTNPGKRVLVRSALGVRVLDPAHAGEWVSLWSVGSRSVWLGWVQADLTGALTVDLPSTVAAGRHRIAVKDATGTLIGWDAVTVAPAGGGTGGGGAGGGGAPSPDAPTAPTPAAPPQNCAPGVVLETGHIDAFFVSAANGRAVLQLMEDVTGHRVVREAESVLLRVRESAYRSSVPAGAPGTSSGYVLPLTQDAGLIWPGWDTNRTAASGHTDVTINITSVDGPGRVHLSTAGPFGDVRSLLTNGGYTLPGSIREPIPVHTHAQWVFSEKGIYTLTVNAVATDPKTGKSLRTVPHRYVFQVGDAPLGDTFCGMRSSSVEDAALVNAAVDEAAAAAIAADQAAAEEAKKKASAATEGGPRTERAEDAAAAGPDADAVAAAPPWALLAIVGGGALIVLAITGGTIGYVRRLRRSEAVFLPGREEST